MKILLRWLSLKVIPWEPSGIRLFDLNEIAFVDLRQPVDVENNPWVCTVCLDNVLSPAPSELCTISQFGCPDTNPGIGIFGNFLCTPLLKIEKFHKTPRTISLYTHLR